MLLAIDTCTERMIVARRASPGQADRWINNDAQGNHARDIVPAIESILEGQRPDAIGIALGPGSFTGVRIGLATAKGLAAGWGIPLVGLDNLEAMADAWSRLAPGSDAAVVPVIDARKQKFYAGLYRDGSSLVPPSDLSAVAWVAAVQAVWKGEVVVSGFQGTVMAEALGSSLPTGWTVLNTLDWTPGLLDQLETNTSQGRFLAADAAPRYLRLSEAEENLRLRSV